MSRAGTLLAIFIIASALYLAGGFHPNTVGAAERATPSLSGVQAQPLPAEKANPAQETPQPGSEKIVPGPQNIRERIGIYVFIAWMWIAIAVMISILRLEIRESDRVAKLKLQSEHKK